MTMNNGDYVTRTELTALTERVSLMEVEIRNFREMVLAMQPQTANTNEFGWANGEGSVADAVRAAAEDYQITEAAQPNWTLCADKVTYYDSFSKMFYDPQSGTYADSSGVRYTFDEETKKWQILEVVRTRQTTSSKKANIRKEKSFKDESELDRQRITLEIVEGLLYEICRDGEKDESTQTSGSSDSRPELTQITNDNAPPQEIEIVQIDSSKNPFVESNCDDDVVVLSSDEEPATKTQKSNSLNKPSYLQAFVPRQQLEHEVTSTVSATNNPSSPDYEPTINGPGNFNNGNQVKKKKNAVNNDDEALTEDEKDGDSDDVEDYEEDAYMFSDEDDDATREAKKRRREERAQALFAPCVRLMETDGNLHVVTIVGATIGRSEKLNEIAFNNKAISRQHCKITYDAVNACYLIEDLSTRNGTFVNANQIDQPTTLRHGDTLQVGGRLGACIHVHIHIGNNTCNGCEPGVVRATAQSAPGTSTDPILGVIQKRNKEGWRRAEMVAMKNKYGITSEHLNEQRQNFEEKDMMPYVDRARKRRIQTNQGPGPEPHFRPPKRPTEPVPDVNIPLSGANKGFAMLSRMGWQEGTGLGAKSSGMKEPINPRVRLTRQGLGHLPQVADSSSKPMGEDERATKKRQNLNTTRQRYDKAPMLDKDMTMAQNYYQATSNDPIGPNIPAGIPGSFNRPAPDHPHLRPATIGMAAGSGTHTAGIMKKVPVPGVSGNLFGRLPPMPPPQVSDDYHLDDIIPPPRHRASQYFGI